METTLDKPAVAVRPLSPALGREILNVDLSAPVSDETFQMILNAWYEGQVILLRNQHISEQQQWNFGLRFGPLSEGHIRELQAGYDGMVYISNVKKDGKPVGILPDGEMQFHSDQCYREFPSQGSMLYALKVPSKGAETCFVNCYAAYDALPADIKAKLKGRKAVYAYNYNLNPTFRAKEIPPGTPMAIHPAVRIHPVTKRKSLFLNRLMTARLEGMPEAESDELLDMIFDHMEQPQFVYEHPWKVGDVLMWDNRCVLHSRKDFDPNEERLLRRITLMGDPVVGD